MNEAASYNLSAIIALNNEKHNFVKHEKEITVEVLCTLLYIVPLTFPFY